MDFKDYYKILGLEKGADSQAVKKAYRKLAGKYHPDKNPGKKVAEEKFKEINEANEVLSDPEKRKRYDELGASWDQPRGPQGGGFGGFSSGGGGASSGGSGGARTQTFSEADLAEMFGSGSGDSADFFETFFGGGQGRRSNGPKGAFSGMRGPKAGNDYQADVEITLEEAGEGAKKIIELNGKKLRLQFKPGIGEGKIIKLEGKGGQGSNGGPSGDFYLHIHVTPHPDLERRGDDLHTTLLVEVQDAILGKLAEIKTLKGSVKLKIPPMSENGKAFRLKGQGMPVYDKAGDFGDMYVTVALKLPSDITPAEEAFFRQMVERRKS